MIVKHRLAAVSVVVAAAGVLTPISAGMGVSAVAASPGVGRASVPVAARGPIAAALRRDGVTPTAGQVRQSSLLPTAPAVGDGLGNDIAVSGNTVVVSSYTRTVNGHSAQGAVYVFVRPSTGWRNVQQVATLTEANGQTNDTFGYVVAISGRTIAVGVVQQQVGSNPGQGAVAVYGEPANGWKTTSHPTATLTVVNGQQYDELGSSVAISGDTIVSGAEDVGGTFDGAAYVFVRPANGWKTTSHPTATLTPNTGTSDFDFFGASVAISGPTIVVGAFGRFMDRGRVYVYAMPPGGWTDAVENRQLVGSEQQNTYFGVAVAVSGNTVAVGEDGDAVGGHTKAGAVYMFVKPLTGWGTNLDPPPAPVGVLTASDAGTNDELGSVVLISGTRVLASAPGKTVGANAGQGGVYVFSRPGASWANSTESGQLTAAGGAAHDGFGSGIGVGPTFTAVGARSRNTDAGAAYVFAPPGPVMSGLRQSHQKWRLGTNPARTNPAHKPKGGTVFSFSLTQAATVSLRFTERVRKHTVHQGVLKVHAIPGTTKVYVDGKTGHGKKLVAGHCRVIVTARNANGTTRRRHLKFVVTTAKKH